MSQKTWIITFQGDSAADASQDAAELEEFLRSELPDIAVSLERSREHTLNLGDRVVAVLNAPNTPVFLGKIATFLKRKPSPSSSFTLEIQEGGNKVLFKAEGLTDENFRHTFDALIPPLIKEWKNRKV